jgi:hypothetical protein
MFKKNDIIKLVETDCMSAKQGALAIVTCDPSKHPFLHVKWLEITSHLNGDQVDGGYGHDRFELVSPGLRDKEIFLKMIDKEIQFLKFIELKERFLNILGEFNEDRLENILEDLKDNSK